MTLFEVKIFTLIESHFDYLNFRVIIFSYTHVVAELNHDRTLSYKFFSYRSIWLLISFNHPFNFQTTFFFLIVTFKKKTKNL